MLCVTWLAQGETFLHLLAWEHGFSSRIAAICDACVVICRDHSQQRRIARHAKRQWQHGLCLECREEIRPAEDVNPLGAQLLLWILQTAACIITCYAWSAACACQDVNACHHALSTSNIWTFSACEREVWVNRLHQHVVPAIHTCQTFTTSMPITCRC